MLKLFSALVVAGGLAVASAGAASAQAQQDFTLVNATGYPIRSVYVSPSNVNSWQEDVMGVDVLGEGEEVAISFSRDESDCSWDLKVTFHDDDSDAVWHGIDLCSVSTITLEYDRDSDTTTATLD